MIVLKSIMILLLSLSVAIAPSITEIKEPSATIDLSLEYLERNEYFSGFPSVSTRPHSFEVTTTRETYLIDLSGLEINGIPICVDVSDWQLGGSVMFRGKLHEVEVTTVSWVQGGTFICWHLHYGDNYPDRYYYHKTLGILIFSITGGRDVDYEIHFEGGNLQAILPLFVIEDIPILLGIIFEFGIIVLLIRRGPRRA